MIRTTGWSDGSATRTTDAVGPDRPEFGELIREIAEATSARAKALRLPIEGMPTDLRRRRPDPGRDRPERRRADRPVAQSPRLEGGINRQHEPPGLDPDEQPGAGPALPPQPTQLPSSEQPEPPIRFSPPEPLRRRNSSDGRRRLEARRVTARPRSTDAKTVAGIAPALTKPIEATSAKARTAGPARGPHRPRSAADPQASRCRRLDALRLGPPEPSTLRRPRRSRTRSVSGKRPGTSPLPHQDPRTRRPNPPSLHLMVFSPPKQYRRIHRSHPTVHRDRP